MSFVKCGTLQLSYQYKTIQRLFHRILIGKRISETRRKHPTAYSMWNTGVMVPAHYSNDEGSKEIVTGDQV